jgi:outer membrane protein assembly factor BamB
MQPHRTTATPPPPEEALRVVAPLGVVWIGAASREAAGPLAEQLRALGGAEVGIVEAAGGTWVRARKPWPKDIDEWTHYLHGADGNPVARDRVVGPPARYQWVNGPLWQRSHETDSSISTIVTAQGRLFYIVDEGPSSLEGDHGLPDKWSLAARDAFNGVDLWKVPIRRWGWREWRGHWFSPRPSDIPLNLQKRLVAAGDRVFVTLGYVAPVSQLDARTGAILQTYADTERAGEILHCGGTLFLALGLERQAGARVAAVDAASGRRLWTSARPYRGSVTDYIKWSEGKGGGVPAVPLDPALNLATDGKTVALVDGDALVAIDAGNGTERWRAAFPMDPADASAGGQRASSNLWNGTMIVTDGVVLHASPNSLAAFDTTDGRVLWRQPKKYIGHLWYEWKDVFVIGGLVWTWTPDLKKEDLAGGGGRHESSVFPDAIHGYDLRTGERRKTVALGTLFKANHHHRCYRNKATERFILASRRGTEFVNLEGGPHSVNNWVRGTCHVGMMPANGLQYAPPHPCQCYIEEKLTGMNALAAAEPVAAPGATAGPALERGPALGACGGTAAGAEDWPTFRSDASRSGASATRLGESVAEIWRVTPGRRVSPPVAAGGRVFVSLVDEHQVACLDAKDGRTLWTFTAGARIDSPPTWEKGAVLFGSSDGWIYCVRADDGALAWRFRAAPEERRIGAFGRLESPWPVSGSVLVREGLAYAVAGRSSHLDGGLRIVALDAATGELRHECRLEGPEVDVTEMAQNSGLPQGALADILVAVDDKIAMRSEVFSPALEPLGGKPEVEAPAGYLDDTYFKRTPWKAGGEYGRLLVRDRTSTYYVRMFDSLKGLDPTVYFTPGAKGYLLFAKNMEGRKNSWMERVPVRIRAMALAQGSLVVAGPPDVVDPKDPLGAFEGRKGGRLIVADAVSGTKRMETELPSPPVFNGIALARGCVFLATEDGAVTCFAGR